MNKLWSPWRSSYIESFNKEKDPNTCIFCDAVNDNINSDSCFKVFESKLSYIILNLYPYNSGHLMVVPHRHLCHMNELNTDEIQEIMQSVNLSMNALDIIMKPHGYNFGANIGRAAGAGIDDHIHFHIVPRWSGDTNFMPSLGDVKVISQDLLQTKKNLLKAFVELQK